MPGLKRLYENVQQGKSIYYWLVAVILAVNIAIKFFFADAGSLYLDEAFSVFHAQKTFSDMMAVIGSDPNPPLYFIFLNGWIKLFGISEYAVRAMSSVFSLLSVVVMLLLYPRHFSRGVVLIAVVFFTISNIQTYYALEARCFTLVELTTLLSFYFYFGLYESGDKLKYTLLLAFSNTLIIYSHYVAVYVIVVQAIVSLLFIKTYFKELKFFIASGLLSLLAFVPWIKHALLTIPKAGASWQPVPQLTDIWDVFQQLSGSPVNGVLFLLIIVIGLIFVVKDQLERNQKHKIITLYGWAFVILILTWLVSQRSPMFLPKYMLFVSGGIFLLMAFSYSHIKIPLWIKILLMLCFVVGNTAKIKRYQFHDEAWRDALVEIKKEKTPGSAVILQAWYQYISFAYYYKQPFFRDYKNTIDLLQKDGVYCAYTEDALQDHNYNENAKIIFVQSHEAFVDRAGALLDSLKKMSHFYLEKQQFNYNHIKISVFKNSYGMVFRNDTLTINTPYTIKNGWSADETAQFKGKNVILAGKGQAFSVGISKRIDYLFKTKGTSISVKVSGLCTADAGHSPARLVLSIDGDGGKNVFYFYKSLSECINQNTTWNKLQEEWTFPSANLPNDANLSLYLWNTDDKSLVYLADAKVTLIKRSLE